MQKRKQITIFVNSFGYMLDHLSFFKKKAKQVFDLFSEETLEKERQEELPDFQENPEKWSNALAEKEYEQNFTKYEYTKLLILGLYSLWERDIKNFLYNHPLLDDEKEKINKFSFREINELFSKNISLKESFEKIKVLSLVANVIKHGDGISLERLYKCPSSFFIYPSDFSDKLKDSAKYGFRVSEKDFFCFYDVLQNFWVNLFHLKQITLCFQGA